MAFFCLFVYKSIYYELNSVVTVEIKGCRLWYQRIHRSEKSGDVCFRVCWPLAGEFCAGAL